MWVSQSSTASGGEEPKNFNFQNLVKSIIFPVFTMVEAPALVYLFFHIKHFLTNLLILKWCSEVRGSSKVRYLKIKIFYLLCLVSHWLSDQSFFENDYLSALISLISTQLPPISISHSFTAFQSMIMHISFPWKFHSWKKWKFENFEQNTCYIPQKKAKNI